jgi:glycosyltransferase involved in cell wall biosynthesis
MRPFVSVCTPTYNRRPFIPTMLKCFLHQDYPMDRMEWVIVDDGTDGIEDLLLAANIPQIKYVRLPAKVPLGEKRNIMHRHAVGDILVYMDDDDYYPPERVSHAVEVLQANPQALCAGSTILFIYFKHLDKIMQFGPYGSRHATAGTFAFRRELLADTAYDDTAALGEERSFLKNYTVPFAQLDPRKVILVFSHSHNTFDKKTLLIDPSKTIVRESPLQVTDFVQDIDILHFFLDRMHVALAAYGPGDPALKPDVQAQMAKISIMFGDKILTGNEILAQLNYQQRYIELLKSRLNSLS